METFSLDLHIRTIPYNERKENSDSVKISCMLCFRFCFCLFASFGISLFLDKLFHVSQVGLKHSMYLNMGLDF